MPPMDQGPPRAVSPCRHRRHRPRCNLVAAVSSADLTPPESRKTRTPVRSSLPCGRLILLPERQPIVSSELINMANDVEEEERSVGGYSPSFGSAGPTFERGRLYELYSARRNERLERKQGQMATDDESADVGNDPRVAVELSQRRCAKKASSSSLENVRKSVPANFSLRSGKEMKKKGSVTGSCQKPTAAAGKRFTTPSVRRT